MGDYLGKVEIVLQNLSCLFSGIGDVEIALHLLGIVMNNVVSVEISEVNGHVVWGWSEQTN